MKRWLIFCLTLLLLAAGCAAPVEEEPEGLKLWFLADMEPWGQSAAALESCPYTGEENIPDLLHALLDGPQAGSGLTSPIPEGTHLWKWSMKGDVLYIDLSRPYASLEGLELTLADYCIVLTMAQLEPIRGVCITINGTQVRHRERQILYVDEVVFTGAEEEPVEISTPLYFLRKGSDQLGYENRVFRLTESELPSMAVLEALVAGPEDEGLTRLIPEGVEVYSARVEGGICYADFSAALMETVPLDEESQVLILSSVVETLCGLDAVSTVQILVEGEAVSYYGMVDVSQPLEPAGGRS